MTNINTNTDLKINCVPSLTWHFLKMNDARLKWQKNEGAALTNAVNADNIFIENNGSDGYFPKDDIQTIFDENDYARISVSADKNEEKTARICFDGTDGSKAAKLCVNAAEGSSVTVYITFKGSAFLAVRTYTVVGKNASVKLILTELNDENGRLITDNDTLVEENGTFTVLRFCPGTASTHVQSRVLLKGNESKLISETAYLGAKSQKLDMNYVIAHIGKRTSCEVKANGALDDNASKIFRGTIDFRCGSSGSFGNESENVLLLSNDIENKTLPVILCDEEDVNGNHGATIGRISEETLLYFASRGISEEEAQKLLTASISDAFCRLTGDEETTKQIIRRTRGDEDE